MSKAALKEHPITKTSSPTSRLVLRFSVVKLSTANVDFVTPDVNLSLVSLPFSAFLIFFLAEDVRCTSRLLWISCLCISPSAQSQKKRHKCPLPV